VHLLVRFPRSVVFWLVTQSGKVQPGLPRIDSHSRLSKFICTDLLTSRTLAPGTFMSRQGMKDVFYP
jgi:hypothetical protein